jgi:hypothetical protein
MIQSRVKALRIIHKNNKQETINNNVSDKPKRFSPPTIDEIKNYCLERKVKWMRTNSLTFILPKVGWSVKTK